MEITFLGHAGFFVETPTTMLIMDPWVSKNGAFDGGWFQYPRNHHMADFITKKLSQNNAQKEVFIYISHEHKDHFDPHFLKKLEPYTFQYIIPNFRRTLLYNQIKAYSTKNILLCNDEELIQIGEGDSIRIYTDDGELNRDSAILFESNEKRFLNMNDCKIHDRLGLIKQQNGKIDVFTVQFSGATWHPTCYDYSEKEYAKISRKKKRSKFEATAFAIENLAPSVYIPSAGPPCFLDPDTTHLNFQKESIFPRSHEVVAYLQKRLRNQKLEIIDLMPADSLLLNETIETQLGGSKPIQEDEFHDYITKYSKAYASFFAEIKVRLTDVRFKELLAFLITEFQAKMDNFKSRAEIERPLYLSFIDQPNHIIKIDFKAGRVGTIPEITEQNHYSIKVFTYDMQRIKESALTWEDYSLTFRMKLSREPDIYQVLMQGFLILEKEDLNFFCDKMLEIENRNERITVEVGGCKYRIDRYCPHQGADLTHAWFEKDKFLVCPRHRWEFDLEDEGVCKANSSTVNAIPLEEN